ncbi:MAG: TauD/TfdA family dioxygenase [Acidimicrobiales bacterium]|nr:TauD/TfdA family dioxygenase [Acidimicrobiales bacterium]
MALEVIPSGQACGATVRGVDLTEQLDEATVAEIRSAWLQHKVLAFPGQPISDDDLERFTLCFGPFGQEPFFEPIDGRQHIAAIHRRADETSPLFAENWHSDWSFLESPPDGTCLLARIIPPHGGDTLYTNQVAALAAMPAELRARIDGKIGIHSARGGYAPDGTYGENDADDRAMRIVYNDSAYASQTHPLIRVHPETGDETLFSALGYIIGIEGMDDTEARSLLAEVYAWETQERFHYRHRWEPDMLVMWDNRCLLHRATGGYDGYERLLHRTTIGANR